MNPPEEHPSIVNRDWRLQAVTTVAKEVRSPTADLLIPVGTPIDLVGFMKLKDETVGIHVPSAIALYVSLAQRLAQQGADLASGFPVTWLRTKDGTKQMTDLSDAAFFDTLENLAGCVVFSFAALEVFANSSIPEEHVFARPRQDGRCTETYTKAQIERHLSLEIKLSEILPPIYSVSSFKGNNLWKEFTSLQRLRDRLVHPKSVDCMASKPESAKDYLWSWLVQDRVRMAPEVALSIIEYFVGDNKPRWLRKLR